MMHAYKLTTDNWYPSFTMGIKKLVFVSLDHYDDNWTVQAGGDDDYHVIFRANSREQAMSLFMVVLAMDTVEVDTLLGIGFKYD